MLRLINVKRSTWQNWVRGELLNSADNGVYREKDVVEAFIAALLVSALGSPREARAALLPMRTDLLDELMSPKGEGKTLVIEPRLLRLRLLAEDAPLQEALTPGEICMAIPLADSVRRLREDFWRFANAQSEPSAGQRSRKARRRRVSQQDHHH